MRKKNKENKQQPKLMEWVAGEQLNHQKMTEESRKEQLDREIGKLMKLRKEIENKKQQEDKIIQKIIRLHISQINDERQKVTVLPEEEREQEYLILTTDQSLKGIESPSMLKLCLGDYGELHVNSSIDKDKNEQNEETRAQNEGQPSEASVNQWQTNGSINPQFLTDYQSNFLLFLQQMQYTIDSTKEKSSIL